MFNNFLDSLDISGANHSSTGNTYGAGRNRSIQSNGGGKLSSSSTNAMRSVHNNTVTGTHGGVPAGPSGAKRNKQLVSGSFNMTQSQAAAQQQNQNYAAMRLSHQGFNQNGLNSSLVINMQQQPGGDFDMNNSGIP